MNSYSHWLNVLRKLRVDRSQGIAPHKPLLLLVVMEIIEKGDLPGNSLNLTPELAFRFIQFWSVVSHRRTQRPDVRLPFYHLKSDGVWQTLTKDNQISEFARTTARVEFDPDFRNLVDDSEFRKLARRILIDTYFEPSEHTTLASLVGLDSIDTEDFKQLADLDLEAPVQAGRAIRFRLDIVSAYNYTCALTGYRVTTIAGGSIIDAAHIHQFSSSRNNDPRNGLALCKNAHWMFDHGIWSLDDDYRVIVAHDAFDEFARDQKPLRELEGTKIQLPQNPHHWPAPAHLAWHRKHKLFQQ
jgi:putative restriction endonuclease